MPSTTSTSVSKPLLSSTVITPSLPTLSMASAMSEPITSSRAEMVATWATSSRPRMGRESSLMRAATTFVAASMPTLSPIGLAPAATMRSPSTIIAWARTTEVVVPSPAMSLVLTATSLTSCAPMFSKGSASSISRAMVTPSLVMTGEPYDLSSTTLRPLGPSVMRTTSAS